MQRHGERGVMLMQAIVLMGLVSLVVATVSGVLIARTAAVRSERASIQATYAAESGIAATIAAMRAGESTDSTLRGGVAECSWQVVMRRDPSSGEVTLESTGDCGSRQKRIVCAASGPDWALRRID